MTMNLSLVQEQAVATRRRLLLTSALLVAAVALPAVATPAAMTDGEVRKVSKDTGKITLKHGEIKNLDMPPMTMVFQVKDPSALDKLKPGDKVRFHAEKQASGALVVTEIELSP